MASRIPSKLYQFHSFQSKYSLQSLARNQIWYSKPNGLNDPFDSSTPINWVSNEIEKMNVISVTGLEKDKSGKYKGTPRPVNKGLVTQNEEQKRTMELTARALIQLSIDEYSQWGVACFTTELKNILMWSHYTNGHRGFCLEFNTKHLPHREKLKKVVYNKSYPTLSPSRMFQSSKIPLYTKSSDWKYEKEWRIIIQEGNSTVEYDPVALRAVYFGCSAQREDMVKAMEILKGTSTQFYKMQRSRTEFKLEAVLYRQ